MRYTVGNFCIGFYKRLEWTWDSGKNSPSAYWRVSFGPVTISYWG